MPLGGQERIGSRGANKSERYREKGKQRQAMVRTAWHAVSLRKTMGNDEGCGSEDPRYDADELFSVKEVRYRTQ